MNFSASDFVTPETILSDALLQVDEEGYETLTPGFFIRQIQKCLEALSFDTYFHEVTTAAPMPQNLRLPVPKGMFNLRRIYLFNGEECNILNSVTVYHKRHYFTKGREGYLAQNKGLDQQSDPFHERKSLHSRSRGEINRVADRNISHLSDYNRLYFYEIEGGIIMFSSNCLAFEKVAMQYNGIHTDIGDKPIIPNYLREVVEDWVVESALRVKKARDTPRWSNLHQEATHRLGYKPYNMSGSWYNAEMRVKRIDKKEREDLLEYLMKMDY